MNLLYRHIFAADDNTNVLLLYYTYTTKVPDNYKHDLSDGMQVLVQNCFYSINSLETITDVLPM